MSWNFFLTFLLAMCLLPASAQSQQSECIGSGIPGGYSWSVCLHPWNPQEHVAFDLNFAGLACTPYVQEQFDIQRSGNVFSIYYDYVTPSGCFGVPAPPRLFTSQDGLTAGDYTVRLFQRSASGLPFPPFDPGSYTLAREMSFTVRGAAQATPVPAGDQRTWVMIALGLLALAVMRLRRDRAREANRL